MPVLCCVVAWRDVMCGVVQCRAVACCVVRCSAVSCSVVEALAPPPAVPARAAGGSGGVLPATIQCRVVLWRGVRWGDVSCRGVEWRVVQCRGGVSASAGRSRRSGGRKRRGVTRRHPVSWRVVACSAVLCGVVAWRVVRCGAVECCVVSNPYAVRPKASRIESKDSAPVLPGSGGNDGSAESGIGGALRS